MLTFERHEEALGAEEELTKNSSFKLKDPTGTFRKLKKLKKLIKIGLEVHKKVEEAKAKETFSTEIDAANYRCN